MKYTTETQKVVVETRLSMGYSFDKQANGTFLLYKGKHTMCINRLGYDIYIPKGNL